MSDRMIGMKVLPTPHGMYDKANARGREQELRLHKDLRLVRQSEKAQRRKKVMEVEVFSAGG